MLQKQNAWPRAVLMGVRGRSFGPPFAPGRGLDSPNDIHIRVTVPAIFGEESVYL
jgi:hypothetical protein